MTPREIVLVQEALYAVSGLSRAARQRCVDAMRDAIYALEMSGADAPTRTGEDALALAERLFNEALPQFNWRDSALDANAIDLLNRAPAAILAALREAR